MLCNQCNVTLSIALDRVDLLSARAERYESEAKALRLRAEKKERMARIYQNLIPYLEQYR